MNARPILAAPLLRSRPIPATPPGAPSREPGTPPVRREPVARALCALGVVLALSGSARANLRAPREVAQPPSAALQATPGRAIPGAPAVVVQRETLQLTCAGRCEVAATYHLKLAAPAALALEFVLPQQTAPLQVQVDDAAPQQVATDRVPEAEAARYLIPAPHRGLATPLARARFSVSLPAGAVRLQVRYSQEPALHEHDYGYFKKGRFVSSLRYELWPLREWTLAPDFALHLEVRLLQRRPGFWQRAFGKRRDLRCAGLSDNSQQPLPGAARQEAEALVFSTALSSTFPDRLECRFGDQDLL